MISLGNIGIFSLYTMVSTQKNCLRIGHSTMQQIWLMARNRHGDLSTHYRRRNLGYFMSTSTICSGVARSARASLLWVLRYYLCPKRRAEVYVYAWITGD